MDKAQESLIGDGVFPTPPKKFPVVLIIGGVILLGLGILGGVMLASWSPTSYEECIKAKGNRMQEIYPATCITKDGRSFVQLITENEQMVCGGWNTGGEIVCGCSGKLIKPDCPAGTICDGGDYLCKGQCGSCCWRGAGEDVEYGGPYSVCDSDSTKLPDKLQDRVCELGEEYESNAVDGPACQCPAGFQPEVVSMSMGPCPIAGTRDCPSTRFKCSNLTS